MNGSIHIGDTPINIKQSIFWVWMTRKSPENPSLPKIEKNRKSEK